MGSLDIKFDSPNSDIIYQQFFIFWITFYDPDRITPDLLNSLFVEKTGEVNKEINEPDGNFERREIENGLMENADRWISWWSYHNG